MRTLAVAILVAACSGKPADPVPHDAGALPPDAQDSSADAGTGAGGLDPAGWTNVVISAESSSIDLREDGYWLNLAKASAETDDNPAQIAEAATELPGRLGFVSCREAPGEAEVRIEAIKVFPEDGSLSVRFEFRSGALLDPMTGVRIRVP